MAHKPLKYSGTHSHGAYLLVHSQGAEGGGPEALEVQCVGQQGAERGAGVQQLGDQAMSHARHPPEVEGRCRGGAGSHGPGDPALAHTSPMHVRQL